MPWGCQLIVNDLQGKSVESHIGKSVFDLGFVKGRIVKCSLFLPFTIKTKYENI